MPRLAGRRGTALTEQAASIVAEARGLAVPALRSEGPVLGPGTAARPAGLAKYPPFIRGPAPAQLLSKPDP
jgi:hypothetical protein